MLEQMIEADGTWIRVVKKIEPEPIDAPRLRFLPDDNGRYYEDPDGFEALDVTMHFFARLLASVPNQPQTLGLSMKG
jgi:hypothetical protein